MQFNLVERADLMIAVKCPCKFYTKSFSIALAYQLNKRYYFVVAVKQINN